MPTRHYCPSCGAELVAEALGASLRCERCGWHLVTLEAWKKLSPIQQGFTFYAQGSWPTSEIANEKNPYARETSAWIAFREGERRATLAAQDSDE